MKKKRKSRKALTQKVPLTYNGAWLRFVRNTILALTQEQLAAKMGVTRITVWNWEHDRGVRGLPKTVIEAIKGFAMDALQHRDELHQQVINPGGKS